MDSQIKLAGGKALGQISDLQEIVADLEPDRIVVGMADRRNRLPLNQPLQLRLSGIRIEDALATYEATFGWSSTCGLRPPQLIFSKELGPKSGRLLAQSFYSLCIAALAAMIATPIMLLVANLVKVSSPGPALFLQQRIGKNNVVFATYKFRSMSCDVEATSGAVWARKDDPRVTLAGKWLHRWR